MQLLPGEAVWLPHGGPHEPVLQDSMWRSGLRLDPSQLR